MLICTNVQINRSSQRISGKPFIAAVAATGPRDLVNRLLIPCWIAAGDRRKILDFLGEPAIRGPDKSVEPYCAGKVTVLPNPA
jgi:hypothetical protein